MQLMQEPKLPAETEMIVATVATVVPPVIGETDPLEKEETDNVNAQKS